MNASTLNQELLFFHVRPFSLCFLHIKCFSKLQLTVIYSFGGL